MNILGSNSYAKLEAVLNMLGFNKYILSFNHNPYTLFRRSINFNLKKKTTLWEWNWEFRNDPIQLWSIDFWQGYHDYSMGEIIVSLTNGAGKTAVYMQKK